MARIVFMGTPDFAVASAQALLDAGHDICAVVTVADKPAGRGRKMHFSELKKWAKQNELPVLQPVDLRNETFIKTLHAYNADVFVVVAFRILPVEVYAIPPKGTINVHGSILPAYRGAAPINWAIINGETKTGVTTFLIDAKVDTGQMLLTSETDISEEETFGDVYFRLKDLGAKLIVKTLDLWMQGTLQPREQQGEITKAPKITPELREINWRQSATNIRNLVRGLAPVPAAFSTIQGKRIKLFEVKALEHLAGAKPGQVTHVDAKNGELIIAAEHGAVKLLDVQLEGKKRMPMDAFLNGFTIEIGEQFGA